MDAQTNPTTEVAATEPQVNAQPPVPDNIIVAHLPHPTTLGGPLSRGARYLHHFEHELVSDGSRLWSAASAEGKAIINTLAEESRRERDAIEAHKAKQAEI